MLEFTDHESAISHIGRPGFDRRYLRFLRGVAIFIRPLGSDEKKRTGRIERVKRSTRFLIGAGSSLPLAQESEALTFDLVPTAGVVAWSCRETTIGYVVV